ncbi:MAG: hypothetical protein PHQ25_01610 [Acidobacteriota bacterium]|nr:hypothetical protein [Acidobacteriota bacterium]MDW3228665.1 hypothetical protein [Acidobacteriota bacterium]MDY0231036.1 hypothetical protein [Candidatus Saccharicenans sp.]
MLQAENIHLPDKIDGWEVAGPPQRIDHTNIFDYMNGGGELYLAYRFDQLLVYRYKKEPDNEILVEIYQMKSPGEAFGLLSLDWTGEPVILNSDISVQAESPVAPSFMALYGEGLLRARVDNLYLRILALRESPEVREVILSLGKIIAGKMSSLIFPEILKVINPEAESPWKIRQDRTAYFHSHLVLNSLFYLSHENLLNLSHNTEGLFVNFEKKNHNLKQSARLLIFKYPEPQAAEAAFKSFCQAYLPEKAEIIAKDSSQKKTDTVQVEDGWLGWRLSDNYLALVFECPQPEAAQDILNQLDLS